MKKYFYKTKFSFLCTPIDIDFLRLRLFSCEIGWGSGRAIWTWNWCGLRAWCQMLFYTLLVERKRVTLKFSGIL